MRLGIKISNVQKIVDLKFNLNFDHGAIVCVTGKNGAGKTTLVKTIRNLTNADTFAKTSAEGVLNSNSQIEYQLDNQTLTYTYEESIDTINCREPVPLIYRKKIFVELPIPHGERFTFFQKISNLDADIRAAIVLGKFKKPMELIAFLHRIYQNSNFDDLVEIHIKGVTYYCRLKSGGRYLREDYFSSGEYFLINLYRRVSQGYHLIVIDEVDISLDAAAQVRLIESLRDFGVASDVRFFLTTHSLAMMQTLKAHELFHLEFDQSTGVATIKNLSYNYIKSVLFGFKGWDKYILTEDEVLKELLEHLILVYCKNIYFSYKIIYVGGGENTVDLMKRNQIEEFLSASENVISVLDGDQKKFRHAKGKSVLCIPFESFEKELLAHCLEGGFRDKFDFESLLNCDLVRFYNFLPIFRKMPSHTRAAIPKKSRISRSLEFLRSFCMKRPKKNSDKNAQPCSESEFSSSGKRLLKEIIGRKIMTRLEVIQHLCKENESSITDFSAQLQAFLTVEAEREAQETPGVSRS